MLLVACGSNRGDAFSAPKACEDKGEAAREEGIDPAGLVKKAVDYGMFTWEEVCTAEAAQTTGCKENG